MNLTPGQSHEAYIGPPSELVDVAAFLEAGQSVTDEEGPSAFTQSAASLPPEVRKEWEAIPQEQKDNIRAECWCVYYSTQDASCRALPYALNLAQRR